MQLFVTRVVYELMSILIILSQKLLLAFKMILKATFEAFAISSAAPCYNGLWRTSLACVILVIVFIEVLNSSLTRVSFTFHNSKEAEGDIYMKFRKCKSLIRRIWFAFSLFNQLVARGSVLCLFAFRNWHGYTHMYTLF